MYRVDHPGGAIVKEPILTQQTDHDRNDRIEATVMVAALASLGLLVALAVSTSVAAVSRPDRQAAIPAPLPDTARERPGFVTPGAALPGNELR